MCIFADNRHLIKDKVEKFTKFKLNILTRKVVNDIIFDKESCRNQSQGSKRAVTAYKIGGIVTVAVEYYRKEQWGVPLKNKLKEYRAKLGVNQQEMGKMAGVSRQTISQIERGDYSPSVTLALKLAKLCHMTVEDIFEYEEAANIQENFFNAFLSSF